MEACRSNLAHLSPVSSPLEVARAYGYGSTNAKEGGVTERRDGDDNLMRSQRHATQPTHHNGRKTKGSGFEPLLQSDGPAQGIEPTPRSPIGTRSKEAKAIRSIATLDGKYHHKQEQHDDTRNEGTDTSTIKPQFGHTTLTINKNVVTDDIERIAHDEYPHRHLRVRNCLYKLTEGIGCHQKYQ